MKVQIILVIAVSLLACISADEAHKKQQPKHITAARLQPPGAPGLPKKFYPTRNRFQFKQNLRPKFNPKFNRIARKHQIKPRIQIKKQQKQIVSTYKKPVAAAPVRTPRHQVPVKKVVVAPKQQQIKPVVQRKQFNVVKPQPKKQQESSGLFGLIASLARRFAINRSASAQSRPVAKQAASLKQKQQNNRRRFNNVPANAPKVFFMQAEDIQGYEKFTLDEVIHTEEKLEARSDGDVSVIEYVDAPVAKKEEVASEEKKEEKKEEVTVTKKEEAKEEEKKSA